MTRTPKSVTESRTYRTITEERSRAAAGSRAAQKQFRNHQRVLILSTVGASIAGGLVLYGIDLDTSTSKLRALSEAPWQQVIIILQALCIGVATFCTHRLTTEEFNDRWRRLRLRAEDLRLRREKVALEIAHEAGPDDFADAGEAFVDFAEEQLGWLRDRAAKARGSWRFGAIMGGVIGAVIAAAGALSGISISWVLVLLGLVGVAAPALLAAVKNWSEAMRERERAALHVATADGLADVLVRSDAFLEVTRAHDLAGAMSFAEEVFDVLRQDHQGFGKLMTQDAEQG